MSETLLIHYNIEYPQQATWSLCNDAGELTGKISTGLLSEIDAQLPVVVLLNSQCLHINQLQLPALNQQKLLKAVPYAIEEFIADDIENYHFVISKNRSDNLTSVIGINRDTLSNIVQTFKQANITVEKIIPDALCLPAEGGRQWACLNYQDTAWLQTEKLHGMSLSKEVLPYVISEKLRHESQQETTHLPEKILFFSEQDSAHQFDEIQQNIATEYPEIENINVVYNSHPLVIFCGQYKQAAELNLLQHDFKPQRKSSGYWLPWRLAASLAAVWLLLDLGITGYQQIQIRDQNNITQARIEKIYKKAFPKSRKIINPRVQMEQKLKELKNAGSNNSNGLLFLLAESFGTLDSARSNLNLQSLTFRNNRMDISLDGENLQAIETLNNNINNNRKIKSEITSSSSEKNIVKGNLRIEGRS